MLMKSFTKGFIIFVFIACNINVKAQIGINISDPDTGAILHIDHQKKGVLFPRVEEIDKVDKVNGTFFYSKVDQKFYYYEEESDSYQCVNPFNSTGEDNASLVGDLNIQNGDITVQEGDLTVEIPNTINGYGTTPIGGIIMWSGDPDILPVGWELCDGGTYIDFKGVSRTIPNLKGRFVVGYNPSDVDYDDIGSPAGEKKHKLTSSESGLPSHDHTMNHLHTITDPGHIHNIRTSRDGGNGYISKQDSHNTKDMPTKSATTGITVNQFYGSTASKTITYANEAHENRPPYYVVAYIIRVK